MSSAFTPEVAKLAVILGFILVLLLTFSIGGMITAMRARRAALELIQRALDKGQPLDPGLVEKLFPPAPAQSYPRPGKLGLMPGIMTIALGVGVSVTVALAANAAPDQLYKAMGGGVILICLGIGLLISSGFYKPEDGA